MSDPQNTLGIIAGEGLLPIEIVQNCQATGRSFFVLALDGFANVEAIAHVPHAVVRLGAVGEAIEYLKNAHVKDLVLAGHVKRPKFSSLRPDKKGAKLIARLGTAFFSGDDAVLRTVIAFLEEEGFAVVGSDSLLLGVKASEGILGNITPTAQALADIKHGKHVLEVLGPLDIGQAVIVENGYVLGIEAAEGTQMLIERCGTLRRDATCGVLVKCRKNRQDERVDLPAIGPDTIEQLAQAGFAGIAIDAGGLILDKKSTVARADTKGIFIMGIANG